MKSSADDSKSASVSEISAARRKVLSNPTAEASIISAMVHAGKRPDLVGTLIIAAGLHPDHFTHPAMQRAFCAISMLAADDMPIDLVTLTKHLDTADLVHVDSAMKEHVSNAHFEVYTRLLKESHQNRLIHAATAKLADAAKSGADPFHLQQLLNEVQRLSSEGREPEGVVLESADSIAPEPIRWLWPGWLALGKLHILAGLPGTGKTTLALAQAATVSCGGRWPDGSRAESGRVVIWSSEDDAGDTLIPRLMANGADRSRISLIKAIRDKRGKRPFDPSKDLPTLQMALAGGDTRLMVIDSIMDAVAGDSHKGTEVRRALFPLKELAESANMAIQGISHFNKNAGSDAMARVLGSISFTGMARIISVAFKQADEQDSLLMRTKSNIGPDNGGYQYRIQPVELTEYPDIQASGVLWGDFVEGDASDLLRKAEDQSGEKAGAKGDAKALIDELLKDGPVAQQQIEDAAKKAGISYITMKRAKQELGGIGSKRIGGAWYWGKPDQLNKITRDGRIADTPCPKCHGTGNVGYGKANGRCFMCSGSGMVPKDAAENWIIDQRVQRGEIPDPYDDYAKVSDTVDTLDTVDSVDPVDTLNAFKGIKGIKPENTVDTLQSDNNQSDTLKGINSINSIKDSDKPAVDTVDLTKSPTATRILECLAGDLAGMVEDALIKTTSGKAGTALTQSTINALLLAGKISRVNGRLVATATHAVQP